MTVTSLNTADLLNSIKNKKAHLDNKVYQPVFFRLKNENDKEQFLSLLKSHSHLTIYDTIFAQLKELIRSRYPFLNLTDDDLEKRVTDYLKEESLEEYGVWVFYPWSNRLLHILDEKEFIEVRTNRNKHKITDDEEKQLRNKKVAVIGLSVGQSIAVTLALERICGELRLADFDFLELSNYNRIRTGLHNLGVSKTVAAAREILEIDPYIKITCYHVGVNENNIDDFLLNNGKVDLLIEECDSLDIKMLSRQKAKEHSIPLLMDTNDKGMLDIERYDLQPDYKPFHGLLGNVNYISLKGLTNEQKLPYYLRLLSPDAASKRLRVSLLEVNQSIRNFPQLASSVVLGAAIVTDVGRRILLNQLSASGRFHVDVENIIKDDVPVKSNSIPKAPASLSLEEMREIATKVIADENTSFVPSKEVLQNIVTNAGLAPSSGNDQPWKWFSKNGQVLLFHEVSRSFSFGDYRNMASYISLGAALENFVISAHHHHLELKVSLFPYNEDKRVIASLEFKEKNSAECESHFADNLFEFISKRYTNRKIAPRKILSNEALAELKSVTESFNNVSLDFSTKPDELKALGEIISSVDRMRLLHPHGHYDFFRREMRWSAEEANLKRTGMDVNTLEIPPPALLALKVLSDENVAKVLYDINGGHAIKGASVPHAVTASAMGLVTTPTYSEQNFIIAGRAIQRQWLKATELGMAYQPLIAPLYLFPRVTFGNGEGLSNTMVEELIELRKRFLNIFPGDDKRGEAFLFRVFMADEVVTRSLRLPLDEILIIEN